MGKKKAKNAPDDEGPGEFYCQVISGRTVDSAPAVFIGTKHERFLVNAGAGLQRVCVEQRVRTVRFTRVLLTHLDPDTVGGLPGLVLTVADGGRAEMHLTGPPGLKAFVRAAEPFMRRDFFSLQVKECGEHGGGQRQKKVGPRRTEGFTGSGPNIGNKACPW